MKLCVTCSMFEESANRAIFPHLVEEMIDAPIRAKFLRRSRKMVSGISAFQIILENTRDCKRYIEVRRIPPWGQGEWEVSYPLYGIPDKFEKKGVPYCQYSGGYKKCCHCPCREGGLSPVQTLTEVEAVRLHAVASMAEHVIIATDKQG